MTILGQHTIAETRDLIRSLQFRITKNDQQLSKVQQQRLAPPTATQVALDNDWVAFIRVWTDERDKNTLAMAAGMAANPGVAPFVLPAESNFKAITNVTQARVPHLGELQQRISAEAAALSLPPVDLTGTPPQDSPDADFQALRKLDAAIGALGNPLGKPGGTDSVAKSPLGLILIGGAVLAGVVGILYVKTAVKAVV